VTSDQLATINILMGLVFVFGFVYSVFLGIYAVRIFIFEGRKPQYTEKTKPGWPWKIFQFWFNFICCQIGFGIAIYYLHRFCLNPDVLFKVEDVFPLLLALLGVTGLLPRTLFYGIGKLPWLGAKD